MNDLLSQVPGVGRKVEQPFRGFGVKFGTERADNQAARDLVLVDWSPRFPSTTFVYLYVECFGGVCDHAGFAFRDGQVLEEIEFTESDVPLRRLLLHLGVELGERAFFAPLRRGYFGVEGETGR